jgi:hypothetical protein
MVGLWNAARNRRKRSATPRRRSRGDEHAPLDRRAEDHPAVHDVEKDNEVKSTATRPLVRYWVERYVIQ